MFNIYAIGKYPIYTLAHFFICLFACFLSLHQMHTLLIDTHHYWPPSASSKDSRSFSIPNMRVVTSLINNEAHRAYASRISPQVLYHLLRATERGRWEINRGICLPAAKPRRPSSHWQNKTSQQPSESRAEEGVQNLQKLPQNHVISKKISQYSYYQVINHTTVYKGYFLCSEDKKNNEFYFVFVSLGPPWK